MHVLPRNRGALIPLALAGLTSIVPPLDGGARQVNAIRGCYRFDRPYFSWSGGLGPPGSTAVVRLAETRARWQHPTVRPAFYLEPVPFAADSLTRQWWQRFSHWRLQDSVVHLVWRNGLYGPVLQLARRGDTLRGTVRFTTDVVGAEPPPEPAWGVRVVCPAP